MAKIWSRLVLVAILHLLLVSAGHGSTQCPRSCSCSREMTNVQCVGQELKEFPSGIPAEVEYLNINGNWIDKLPSLSNFTKLAEFHARGNIIQNITEKTFYGLRKLTLVDLAENRFESFDAINSRTLFASNVLLKKLIIYGNSINNTKAVLASSSLTHLDLSNNKISQLDDRFLSQLPSLTHLNVSRNPVKWVDGLASSSLMHLDMSEANLDGIRNNGLEQLPELRSLIISRNSHFNYIGNLASEKLENYEAEYCEINQPGIKEFPLLVQANLRGNKIETLKSKVFSNPKKKSILRTLNLSHNGLKVLENDCFLGLDNLELLSLTNNQIADIAWDLVIGNYALTELDLSYNYIRELPDNFTSSKLSFANFSHCQIHSLERNTFVRVLQLKSLDLSYNEIETVQLTSDTLKSIDLSFDRITSITNITFSKLSHLESVNLIGNRLTNVPKAHMFDHNPYLSQIRLSDNPWICDCQDQEFQYFWRFITEQPSKLGEQERSLLRCESPAVYQNRKWEDACFAEFFPPLRGSTFFDHYGVYLLIAAMAISFALVVTISIRERLRKREKAQRSRVEERRRTSQRDVQERVVRDYQDHSRLGSRDRALSNSDTLEVIQLDRQERTVSQPPTYEEAVLMPRRVESSSREELDADDIVADEEVSEEVESISGRVTPKLGTIDAAYESDDYDDVADDEDEGEDDEQRCGEIIIDVEEVDQADAATRNLAADADQLDEAKLMQQLRIEVWSREDINEIHHANRQ